MLQRTIALLALLLSCTVESAAQTSDEKQILAILDRQIVSWNKGDLDEFMTGYWNNDSLTFVGKNGVTYGYANTLKNYKTSYATPEKMGKLSFTILQVKNLSSDLYFVIGKWFLQRTAGDVSGHYTLLFRKIDGQWKIVSDHSS